MTEVMRLPFYEKLTDEERASVENASVMKHYAAGSMLFGECNGGTCIGMLHIVKGNIRAYLLSEEGREITLFRLTAGDNCVLSASCVISQLTFETYLEVTEDADILIIPSYVYGALMENNIHVRCFTYELATERFSTVMWVMQQILFLRFDRRLAGFLLDEYRKCGTPVIRMTQEEIAENVNSAREVVARMLKRFTANGLIENGRGVITLKNIDALEKYIR